MKLGRKVYESFLKLQNGLKVEFELLAWCKILWLLV